MTNPPIERFTLVLNSHALTDFQECETKYKYRDHMCIKVAGENKFFRKGSLVATILENYYKRKMRGKNVLIPLNPFMLPKVAQKRLGYSPSDANEFARIMWKYHEEYENEQWIPVAVEKGFSKILWEDASNLFIYEGKPDLIVRVGKDLVGVDHKTQSLQYSIWEFNNQALGYCWGIGLNYFVYNYIKFTKEDWFRRSTHQFSSAQLDAWHTETIDWFFRIKHAICYRTYLKNWTCQTKFGLCDYTSLCTQPSEAARTWNIKSTFKQTKRYRSW